jgi:hypothetical protein
MRQEQIPTDQIELKQFIQYKVTERVVSAALQLARQNNTLQGGETYCKRADKAITKFYDNFGESLLNRYGMKAGELTLLIEDARKEMKTKFTDLQI